MKGRPVSATLSTSALTLLSELMEPPQLKKSNLHEYRLKVKELRNLLQMAENADGQTFVHHLGDVKDAIGEWHDWEILVSTAHDVLEHGGKCRLVVTLRKIAATKFKKALRLSQAMRRNDLRMTKRNAKNSSRRLQPAEQVWSATASLTA